MNIFAAKTGSKWLIASGVVSVGLAIAGVWQVLSANHSNSSVISTTSIMLGQDTAGMTLGDDDKKKDAPKPLGDNHPI